MLIVTIVLVVMLSVSCALEGSTSTLGLRRPSGLPRKSTPLAGRDWQPLVLLFFDASRTGADVPDGILGFFERYAYCNLSQWV